MCYLNTVRLVFDTKLMTCFICVCVCLCARVCVSRYTRPSGIKHTMEVVDGLSEECSSVGGRSAKISKYEHPLLKEMQYETVCFTLFKLLALRNNSLNIEIAQNYDLSRVNYFILRN